jgi:hypothetical protein
MVLAHAPGTCTHSWYGALDEQRRQEQGALRPGLQGLRVESGLLADIGTHLGAELSPHKQARAAW